MNVGASSTQRRSVVPRSPSCATSTHRVDSSLGRGDRAWLRRRMPARPIDRGRAGLSGRQRQQAGAASFAAAYASCVHAICSLCATPVILGPHVYRCGCGGPVDLVEPPLAGEPDGAAQGVWREAV